jgi:mutual gliding-motility protein MglA
VSVINPLARELSAKIVYYGPGLSGKTTSLQYIHSSLKPTHRGELVSLATEGDRTLFFDFLPVHIGKVRDLDVRLQLYTVPGQVFYGATRQLVLEGADGVVFVADSQRSAHERNVESLNDLEENLRKMGTSLEKLPFIIQYNKRDLPDCGTLDEMRALLNTRGVPDFATTASKGVGVVEALKTITRLVTDYLSAQAPKEDGSRRLPLRASTKVSDSEAPESQGLQEQIKSQLKQMSAESPVPPAPSVPEGETASRYADTTSDAEVASSPGIAADSPAVEIEDLAVIPLETPRPPGDVSFSRSYSPSDAKTIQAPAVSPLTFAALWDDGREIREIEHCIATGHFAEAVYRSAGGVSLILDRMLGPHSTEGSGVRAQLLGLDGHEYLQLRRLASHPASTITQFDALFSFYVLIAARIKEARVG